jgi:hypothetical protein
MPLLPLNPGRLNFDMDDASDSHHWPAIAARLQELHNRVWELYSAADEKANQKRRLLKLFAVLATVFGALALMFLFVQLSMLPPDTPDRYGFAGVEAVCALFALVTVLVGLWLQLPSEWQRWRHRAERYRHAKFRWLIRPSLWGLPDEIEGQQEPLLSWLDSQVEARQDKHPPDVRKPGKSATRETLDAEVEKWAEGGLGIAYRAVEAPASRDAAAAPTVNEAGLLDLIEYYKAKRLDYQWRWFHRRGEDNVSWDQCLRFLPPTMFFLGVLSALIHVASDLRPSDRTVEAGIAWLVFLAATLPALGTCVRTVRMAFEFSRNTSRYRAAANTLESVRKALDWAASEGRWTDAMDAMQASEVILENEHREWLRLMKEADWYG